MSSPSASLQPDISRANSSSNLASLPIPNIPPRNRSGSKSGRNSPQPGTSPSPALHRKSSGNPFFANVAEEGSSTPNSGDAASELTEEQKAKIVARHLVDRQGQTRARRASRNPQAEDESAKGKLKETLNANQFEDDAALDSEGDEVEDDEEGGDGKRKKKPLTHEDFPMPFGMQGGDVTHDLYKWQRNTMAGQLKRSKSTGELSNAGESAMNVSAVNGSALPDMSADVDDGDALDPTLDYKRIREPGGFRRNYLNRKYGAAPESGANSGTATPIAQRPGLQPRTSSFVEFLSLYGHFAGESLEEIEEEDDNEDDEAALQAAERGIPTGTPASRNVNERTPLLKRTDTRARIAKKRLSQQGKKGEATVTQAVMMLLKSFVGTGILFLGRAFFNGGIIFSSVVLLSIAMISLYSFLLLVDTRLVVPGSFGEMGGVLYGRWLELAILTSITLSQIGFVAAYTIFVAENLQAFTMAVTNCKVYIPIAILIFAQIAFYLPLAMFRNIHKLSGTALIADAFILFGIVYIVIYETGHLKEYGLGNIVYFNKESFPLLIGTAVFSFEGVGLVIPITEAMAEPEKFPRALTGVMILVAFLFGGSGALGYATFGSDIQTVVLSNMPQDDKFVNAVQFLYSIAIMLSTPLQLFPAVRIMEQGIFSKSGKYSNRVKWQKNIFRSLSVLGCAIISWAGARDLDKFVSLIGSTACVPLCFCYPAMLHYKACAKTRKAKVIDGALIFFGATMAVYTSIQTVRMLAKGEKSESPRFGKCPVPS